MVLPLELHLDTEHLAFSITLPSCLFMCFMLIISWLAQQNTRSFYIPIASVVQAEDMGITSGSYGEGSGEGDDRFGKAI